MKLPQKPKKRTQYDPDTNLLSWMFLIARNEDLLRRALIIIQFIRDHPTLSEDAVRKELVQEQFKNMPPTPLQ
jgi:hypothetical protein